MLDNSSRRGGAFFVLWNPESRSVQLRASISGSHLAFRSFSLQGVRRWVRGDIFMSGPSGAKAWAQRLSGMYSCLFFLAVHKGRCISLKRLVM